MLSIMYLQHVLAADVMSGQDFITKRKLKEWLFVVQLDLGIVLLKD